MMLSDVLEPDDIVMPVGSNELRRMGSLADTMTCLFSRSNINQSSSGSVVSPMNSDNLRRLAEVRV